MNTTKNRKFFEHLEIQNRKQRGFLNSNASMCWNRKGQIPTILLFIVALVLSAATLFSFAGFKGDFSEKSQELFETSQALEFREQYIIGLVKFFGEDSIKQGGDIRSNFEKFAVENEKLKTYKETGNFYKKIRDDQFTFEKNLSTGFYELEIKDLFLISEVEKNRIKRNFGLKMEFDEQGNVRKTFIQ